MKIKKKCMYIHEKLESDRTGPDLSDSSATDTDTDTDTT
jgi:hypothetical protein